MVSKQLFNAQALQESLNYLDQVIQWRMAVCFSENGQSLSPMPTPPNDWLTTESPLTQFMHLHQLDVVEQLTLLMAIAPHLQPDFFDRL
jgi:hypothetical protein